ncbi:MAG: RNA polymerase factor sigma-54 [Sandaracinaceae bacterium]|nr:RNA polymerase factor sigma-54 [Sandaracinaceae bacterium]
MALELKQQLKQTQQLIMTPQLQQAIKMLQMSRLELADALQQELIENPVLSEEEDEEQWLSSDDGNFEADLRSPGLSEEVEHRKLSSIEEAIREDQEKLERRNAGEERKRREIDWERFLENRSLEGPLPSAGRLSDDEEERPFDATLSREEGLVEHLARQIRLEDFNEKELAFAALVLGNLDDDGYLRLDDTPPEQVVPKLAEDAGLDVESAEEVLKTIQRMDPVGVAARDLRECLLVQAEEQGYDEAVLQVIDKHLRHLERKQYAAIAKALNISLEEVYDIAEVIADLDPRPARQFVSEAPQYITPDVYVIKVGDDYIVTANDDGLPRLAISSYYRTAIEHSQSAKEFVQNKLRAAERFIRAIDQRRRTIIRVTECIVEKQRAFFDHGIEHLKPMTLRDVADAIGVHESTVSRVTSNKYVATPRGLFELKFFFNAKIKREQHDDIASESVKQAIKRIIANEDPHNPLSDQRIVEILAQQDIIIARRTVAKYREMLGILNSTQRKRPFEKSSFPKGQKRDRLARAG